MYCKKCGMEIMAGAKFCTRCGTPAQMEAPNRIRSSGNGVGYGAGSGRGYGASYGTGNGTGYGSGYGNGNGAGRPYRPQIEKIIHIGSGFIGFLPIAMSLVFFLFRTVALAFLNGFYLGAGNFLFTVCRLVLILLMLVGIAECIGIIYLAVSGKARPSQGLYFGIAASACAALYGVLKVSFALLPMRIILLVAAAVIGIDLLAKLRLYGTGLCGNFDLPGSIQVLLDALKTSGGNTGVAGGKEYIRSDADNAWANRTAPGSNRATPGSNSYFDGEGAELLGHYVLLVLVSVVTCGIAAPWFLCRIYRWRKSHTVIDGRRQCFDGQGAELLGKWIIWEILTVVTCGLFGFYMAVALKKWEYSHTYYMDGMGPAAAPGSVSWFDGSFASYLGNAIICSLLSTISCGIAYPWASVPLIKWEMEGTVVDGDRYGYFGNGTDMFGIYIVCMLLSIVTCGIYFPWAACRINRYIVSNTHRTVRVR